MTVSILGVRVDRVTFASAIEQIRGFIHHRKPHQVVTVNPEFIVRAQSDTSFRQILNDADLAVPDGAGILWASRVIARRQRKKNLILPERVTGTDLLPALAQEAEREGWRIYLLGGLPGMAKRAGERLQDEWPNLKVVGAECGPQVTEQGRPINRDQKALLGAVIQRIQKTQPEILFVGFGAPKQDRFIARYKKELGAPVMIGVGGAFEFLAGHARRAPRIFQLLWLEWLWRLISQPWRISRVWTAVVRFPLAVFSEKK